MHTVSKETMATAPPNGLIIGIPISQYISYLAMFLSITQ